MVPAEGTPQVLVLRGSQEAQAAATRAGVSALDAEPTGRRALFRAVRVNGLGVREVNVLKHESASRGGDVLVAEDLLKWASDNGSCLLAGTLSQFDRLLARLKGPDTGLRELAVSIETAFHNFEAPLPVCHSGLRMEQAPLLMGILNVTPDSFSDGGAYRDIDHAVTQGLDMVARGAALVDVGGESTRPGSSPVCEPDELDRVLPVVEALAVSIPGRISIDTSKARVAADALAVGAFMINDISALRADQEMVAVVRDADCPVVLMHMLGDPRTMQDEPQYRDVTTEVYSFFLERLNWAVDQGLREENLLIDPGIGFGKTTAHNLTLLHDLEVFRSLGRPVVVGTSRKRFLGELLDVESPQLRDGATAATTALSVMSGAHVIRVHEIEVNRQAAAVAREIREARA